MAEWTAAMVEVQLREALAADPARPPATPLTADALSWLAWLDPVDAQIVRARAAGAPWKLICWRFGIGRATAHRRWTYGLAMSAWRLNGQHVPANWSRRRVLHEIKATSGL
jgi:hypothetical protein